MNRCFLYRSFAWAWCLGVVLLATDPAAVAQEPEIPRLQTLPAGWKRISSITMNANQLASLSRRLGGIVIRGSNIVLEVDGKSLQINSLACRSDEDADKVHAEVLRIRQGNQTTCPRVGKTIIEFVTREPALVERAYQELRFPGPRVTYLVTFRAAPIEKCDYEAWNKFYNACLAPDKNDQAIRDLAKNFTFADSLTLRRFGQGKEPSTFTFRPSPSGERRLAEGELLRYSFADLPTPRGVPEVNVEMQVSSQAYAITPSTRKPGAELLSSNEFWPTQDAEIVKLSQEIVQGKSSTNEKVQALLDWCKTGKNLRYAGAMGSRYGVKQVLKQGHGRCWDFSDCFVTLARASGVPCRQVIGWLHGESGHVWAEILVEGEGWRPVDPTAGMGCDSRYIPYIASEDGRMPIVYTSKVEIEIKK